MCQRASSRDGVLLPDGLGGAVPLGVLGDAATPGGRSDAEPLVGASLPDDHASSPGVGVRMCAWECPGLVVAAWEGPALVDVPFSPLSSLAFQVGAFSPDGALGRVV